MLWPILLAQAQMAARRAESNVAAGLRQQAQAIVLAIAANIADPARRAAFLAQAETSASRANC